VLKKILTGDKSDNIPPICAGIGSKTADKLLAMNDEDRETWIRTKGASAWDQYLINLRLIELSHIPQEYVDEVVENLKEKEI
jgi:5'-3' exonuclease